MVCMYWVIICHNASGDVDLFGYNEPINACLGVWRVLLLPCPLHRVGVEDHVVFDQYAQYLGVVDVHVEVSLNQLRDLWISMGGQ